MEGRTELANLADSDHMLLDVFSDYCNMPLLSILAIRKGSRHIEESKNSSTGNEYREMPASLNLTVSNLGHSPSPLEESPIA